MTEIKARFTAQSVDPAAADPVPVKVAGVYCDLAACIAATHQLQDIANRCPSVCRFDATWWSFDSLQAPEVRETAARAAAEADIVWCSACACEPLPYTVKAWMNDWAAHKRNLDAALVALLRCPLASHNFEQSPTRLCLCAAAREAGMGFCERKLVCDCPPPHTSLTKPEIPPQPLSPPDWQATRGWGINE